MKYQTMLSLTFLLLNNKKITLKDVMVRYGISKRTALRYIDEISLSGIPLTVEYGRNGGFYVPEEYKIKRGYFTREETCILKSVIPLLLDRNGAEKPAADKALAVDSLLEKLSALC